MSDDLRDRFASDDEYEDFKNAYNSYKNNEGAFPFDEDAMQELIKFQKLIYESFVINKKKFIAVPNTISGVENSGMYMFHFETIMKEKNFDETVTIILN